MKQYENKELTLQGVVKKLGLSERTIYTYVKKGKLQSYKKKNRLYFPVDQFEHKDQEHLFKQKGNTSKEALKDSKDELIKELRHQNEFLQKQLEKQTEQARNEQILRKEFQDKFLLLNNPTPSVYEASGIKQNTIKNTKTKKKTKKKKKTGFMGFFTRML